MFGLKSSQTIAIMACFLFVSLAWPSCGYPTDKADTDLRMSDGAGLMDKKEMAGGQDMKLKMDDNEEVNEARRMVVNQIPNSSPTGTPAAAGGAAAGGAGGAGGAISNAKPDMFIALLVMACAKLVHSFANY